jgi:ribonuclease PH
MAGKGKGWLTAEYGMLPASTDRRKAREGRLGKVDGRVVEIQRLIGRALRCCVDLNKTGERTFLVDCDVIEADGGTRVASINGACLALWDACDHLLQEGRLKVTPFRGPLGAISVGLVKGQLLADLCYEEDRDADADMNVVTDAESAFVEFQASAEGRSIPASQLEAAIALSLDVCNRVRNAIMAAKAEASS